MCMKEYVPFHLQTSLQLHAELVGPTVKIVLEEICGGECWCQEMWRAKKFSPELMVQLQKLKYYIYMTVLRYMYVFTILVLHWLLILRS